MQYFSGRIKLQISLAPFLRGTKGVVSPLGEKCRGVSLIRPLGGLEYEIYTLNTEEPYFRIS